MLKALIESPSTMSHAKRYQRALKTAYLKMGKSLPRNESDADCLQIEVKSVCKNIGPEFVCPSLLVFGEFPIPAENTPADTLLERARAI